MFVFWEEFKDFLEVVFWGFMVLWRFEDIIGVKGFWIIGGVLLGVGMCGVVVWF